MPRENLTEADRLFIAQSTRAIVVTVSQVGAFVMAYFVAVELVAYYRPPLVFFQSVPTMIAVVGFGSFVAQGWSVSRTIRRIDKQAWDAAEAEWQAEEREFDRMYGSDEDDR